MTGAVTGPVYLLVAGRLNVVVPLILIVCDHRFHSYEVKELERSTRKNCMTFLSLEMIRLAFGSQEMSVVSHKIWAHVQPNLELQNI